MKPEPARPPMDLPAIQALLDGLGGEYAFYACPRGGPALRVQNQAVFASASMIKVPLLLAWVLLERAGQVSRDELCRIDDEPQVEGAGFSWLLRGRAIPFQDALLLMIALSDNLCTNLVIRRLGLDRIDRVFHDPAGLGLSAATRLERKLMDYAARDAGRDNWIAAGDCERLFERLRGLLPQERAWVEPLFAVNQDASLLLRDVPRDSLVFYHKTGNIPGVFHDWGWTDGLDLFLLTQRMADESSVNQAFGRLGRRFLHQAD